MNTPTRLTLAARIDRAVTAVVRRMPPSVFRWWMGGSTFEPRGELAIRTVVCRTLGHVWEPIHFTPDITLACEGCGLIQMSSDPGDLPVGSRDWWDYLDAASRAHRDRCDDEDRVGDMTTPEEPS